MFGFYTTVGVSLLVLLGIFSVMNENRRARGNPAFDGTKGQLAFSFYRVFIWLYVVNYALRTVALFVQGRNAAGTGFDALALVMLLYIGITLPLRRPFTVVVAQTFHALAILVSGIVLLTDRAEWVRWGYYVSIMIINALWLAYLLRSRRVRATFRDETPAPVDGVTDRPVQS